MNFSYQPGDPFKWYRRLKQLRTGAKPFKSAKDQDDIVEIVVWATKYKDGLGVKRDLPEALAWLKTAEERGQKYDSVEAQKLVSHITKEIISLKKQMTPTEITEGERRWQKFKEDRH